MAKNNKFVVNIDVIDDKKYIQRAKKHLGLEVKEEQKVCTKRAYDVPMDAVSKIKEIEAKYNDKNARYPKRLYKCENCGKWHLTSMDIEKHEEIVKKQKEIQNLKRKNREKKFRNFLNKEVDYWTKRLKIDEQ